MKPRRTVVADVELASVASVKLSLIGEGMISNPPVLVSAPAGFDRDLQDAGRPDLTVTTAVPNPSWLRALTTWHRADRHIGPIILDVALAYSAVFGSTKSTATKLGMTASVLCAGLLFGVWKRRTSLETQGVAWFVRHLVPTVLVAGAIAKLFVASGVTDRQIASAMVGIVFSLAFVRVVLWQVIAMARRHDIGLVNTLVVGPAHRIDQIAQRMITFPEAGLRLEAKYEPAPYDGTTPQSGRELVDDLLARHDVDHVLCVADEVDEAVFRDFVRFTSGRVDVSALLPLARLFGGMTQPHLGDLRLVPIRLRPSWGSTTVKRIVDVLASAILLLVCSPFLLVTALAIRLTSPGPVIFRQQRVGYQGITFTIFKFRSMVAGAESQQAQYRDSNVHRSLLFKVDRDPRVTPIGNLIRRFSIDELPQLFNVLRGEMSLVGPRPLAVDPDEFDTGAQIRHRVLPGITGLWQVNGANALPYVDMVELDLTYVATHSLGVDLMLLVKTIPALLVRRAAY